MPLSCLDERQTLYAYDHGASAWAALAADNRQRRHLRAPCCDARVALKTSRLGTRFFAHLARGGCSTADESADHLELKALAVAAARAAGWDAATEVAGITPDGQVWRADVLATRGRHRVAVEVQWSPQADDETLRRQAQYAASGVRCLWLLRQRRFPASQDLPAVRVGRDAAKLLVALGQPVTAVLDAAFAGRLKFGIPTGATARVRVESVAVHCWAEGCDAITRAIERVAVTYGDNRCALPLSLLGNHPSVVRAIVDRLPADRARGRLALRSSKAAGRAYLANGCVRCDRLIGERFLSGAAASRGTLAAFDIAIDSDWRRAIDSIDHAPVWSVVAPAAPGR